MKSIIERKLNRKLPIRRSPMTNTSDIRSAQPAGTNHSGDFLPVLLNEIPAAVNPSSDQIEIWLPDGTRIVASGEKCLSLFSSIIKERL